MRILCCMNGGWIEPEAGRGVLGALEYGLANSDCDVGVVGVVGAEDMDIWGRACC